ncbi:MAG: hypothetical protein R3C26_18505 [Calditrichia bacterium]
MHAKRTVEAEYRNGTFLAAMNAKPKTAKTIAKPFSKTGKETNISQRD